MKLILPILEKAMVYEATGHWLIPFRIKKHNKVSSFVSQQHVYIEYGPILMNEIATEIYFHIPATRNTIFPVYLELKDFNMSDIPAFINFLNVFENEDRLKLPTTEDFIKRHFTQIVDKVIWSTLNTTFEQYILPKLLKSKPRIRVDD